jgi:hypothetical protein
MLTSLKPQVHKGCGETWEVARERLDAEWLPLADEKGRTVHGYAIVEEIPVHMLGRVIVEGSFSQALGTKAFGVSIIATRDGKAFGASPRTTRYATREEAITSAQKALVQQGKRYAKKYGDKVASPTRGLAQGAVV